uniref:Pre-mRNA-splicing regulator WTAP n=2 Tax=Arion vulgaris TaxID=1028688 RepID=A0A0B7A7W1_9EUPU
MSESSSSPKRPRVDYDDSSGKEDHLDKYKNRDREHDDQSIFASSKQQRKRSDPDEDDGKDDDGKTKSVTIETARREHTLVMRLTNKEQELQDCMNQIQEMKQAQTQNTAQLRSMLLDPAINLVFQRMAKEMDEHKEKLKQKQNELSAWKFTPDSQIGKRMMARCRLLLQENADLGKMISSGRTARLEGEIVLHKALVTEMKKNQKELDEFVGELEEDVEGMQGMIFMLQQQLKEAHDQIAKLQRENDQLRTLRMHPDTEPGGSFDGNSNSNTPLHNWTTDASHESEPDSTASKLLISSTQSGKDAGIGVSENVTKKASPVLPSALLTLSDRNRTCATPSDQLSVAQNCEDFTSGTFAFKVTPDSGVQTQEEEDISMDTTDFTTSSLNQQQTCGSDPHRIHSNSHLSSRTTVENAGNNILKKEINSSQTETDRGSISSSTFTHQNLAFQVLQPVMKV